MRLVHGRGRQLPRNLQGNACMVVHNSKNNLSLDDGVQCTLRDDTTRGSWSYHDIIIELVQLFYNFKVMDA